MSFFDFLSGLLSQSGDNKKETSIDNEPLDLDLEDDEEEYPSYEQVLEVVDPDQYHTYIELATSWEEMDEDEWDEKYDSLDDRFKGLVDESISEQTDYE